MTNLIYLISVITTNWVNNGDFKRESGTNWVKQSQSVVTNVYVIEVQLCTNRTHYKLLEGSTTNTRWVPVMGPPMPGVLHKE